ncbi:hypothetical protein Tco_0167473, partial [Tanacetum coccineum]
DHLKMEMEIPCSSIIKFITACSYSNDTFEDIMKAQVSVFKASVTLNIQAFKIKKSASISFKMTQVHKTTKDHMMMIRDYDWMMISKKLKDHIQVKISVFKASATLNIQAFKIKKSVSISFRMTQVHKTAKDHMMMIRDYDWMMISKKLKDHIQVKIMPKSLKFTASDSQDMDK